MKATINGDVREVPDGLTIDALLELLGSKPKSVAVARNDRIVRRAQYSAVQLRDGDRLEIIQAVAGG